MRPGTFLLVFFLLMLITMGCNDTVLEKQSEGIPESVWPYQDTLKYMFDIRDTTAYFDLVAEIRHADEFKNQNLYTRIHTIQPGADTSTQVVSLELADHTGRWYGKCRGNQCTVEIVLQERFKIRTPGTYGIWIEQYMRDSLVQGIERVTLSLLSNSPD